MKVNERDVREESFEIFVTVVTRCYTNLQSYTALLLEILMVGAITSIPHAILCF